MVLGAVVSRRFTADKASFREALDDPQAVYGTPERVLSDPRLDRQGKRAILKAWERDARALARAEDEAMSGGEPNLLDRVLKALRRVTDEDRDGGSGVS